MKWKAPRNGGNSNRTRAAQSAQSRERDGHGRFGFSGHHSWKKGKSGGNKIGASTMPLLGWSASERKYEEHHSFAAKQAELDAIRDGLDAIVPLPDEPFRWSAEDVSDALLDDALSDGLPPGVTFNGQSWDTTCDKYLYDPYDLYDDNVCRFCGRPF